jgi:hypothetical protein
MRKILTTLFVLILCNRVFSQDTLLKSTRTTDTIQLVNKHQSIWKNPLFVWNKPIFKIGDNIYDANELKPIIATHKKAYTSFKAYRFNYTAGTIVSVMTLGSTVALVDAIANKKTVLLPIGAIIGTYFLSDTYFKSSKRQLNKALTLYNSN